MATVGARLRELCSKARKPMARRPCANASTAYGIAENPDGTVRGKPIWFVRYAETYINLGHPDIGKLFNDNDQTLRKYNDFMFQVAVAHDAAADAAERAELERMYVLLTRHLLDQGFAAGSAQGTLHHLGYSMRNFYTAPVVMRDVLRRAGLEHEVQPGHGVVLGRGRGETPADGAGHGHRRVQHLAHRSSGEHRDAPGHPRRKRPGWRPSPAGSTTAIRSPRGPDPASRATARSSTTATTTRPMPSTDSAAGL